jgi:hypothetical protein
MINIPSNYRNSPFTDKKFKELVEFFNKLEQDLQYPNCEGKEDSVRILRKAQDELTKWGVV